MTCSAALAWGRPSAPRCCTSSAHGSSPIYDSHVHRIYANRAAGLALEIDDPSAGWWEAPRRDLLDSADDFAWLADACRTENDPRVRRAGYLPELRLLDILAWTLGSKP
jgi:hypothetical protein